MGRYNGHFSSKFQGCMIVGQLHDESRNRVITCYAIPDEPEVVGFYDGIDTWIGTASMCNKTVQQELAAVQRGEPREIEYGQTKARLLDAPGVMGNPQHELYSSTGGTPRRRAVVTSDAPTGANPPRVERKRATVAPVTPVAPTRERRRAQ